MPRGVVTRLVRLLRMPMRHDGEVLRTAFSRRAAITYSVGVRRFARQKRAAPAAHRSPVAGTGRLAPVVRALLRLPVPVFGLLLGREWCVEVR
ncbi:hypothetical protein ACWC2K_28810 [Streptomyces chattanoogensis]